jgi:hypothetical protein
MSETKTKTPSYGSGSGTAYAYAIEARTTYPEPHCIGELIVDGEWRRVPVRVARGGGFGVPSQTWCKQADDLDLLSYHAALSLAAWFVAAQPINGGCVQMRMVRVRVEWKYETAESGVSGVLFGGERDQIFVNRETGLLKAEAE